MLEVELKFHIHSEDMASRLISIGAVRQHSHQEADDYFNAPDRDFATTDEALRLRSIGSQNFLTYKGPKIDQHTKTRKEIELPLADGQETATLGRDLLQSLGYRYVRSVVKQREFWSLLRSSFELTICFDRVEKLGSFLEIEVVVNPSDLECAKTAILSVAEELQLQQPERRSYLQMLLEHDRQP